VSIVEPVTLPMRILVTGSSGFIGRNIVERLASEHQVLAPRHAELDLQDGDAVARYLDATPVDAVVHSATKPGHRNAKDPTGLLEANTRMFANLTRRRDLCGRVVLLTSGLVYDPRFYSPRMREERFGEHVPADEGGYSKYLCARMAEGLPGAVELRPFGVFGPHEDWEIRFISNAICKCIFDLPITLRQDRLFDYVWVDDLTEVVRRAILGDLPAGAYNVTPDATVALRAVAEKVRRISGKSVEIRVAQPGMGVEYSGDNARLKKALPGLSFTGLEQAIGLLYRWYEERRGRLRRELLLSDK
jgi:UDP-glucose 4-epimerase